jgi:aqualysin 1
MKSRYTSIALGLSLAFPAYSAIAAPGEAKQPVIVVFQQATPFHQFRGNARADERAADNPDAWGYLDRGVLGAVQRLEGLHRFKSNHVYSHAAKGFSAELTPAQIDALKAEPTVAYIEPDQPMGMVGQVVPWGIDRVEADLSSTLAGNGSGTVANVNVYVIDSGIAANADLNLVSHLNFAGGKNTDCNGHGTHVAGTIGAIDNGADVVGVAPGVRLTGVKVLGCNGSGTTSGVIKGIDWVTANAVKPAVANMSLGGGVSQTLDDAIRRSVGSQVFYALAAGNEGVDACNSSPARAGFNVGGVDNGIVTTAAIDVANHEPSWSNYGQCVNIWSPGVNIVSTNFRGGTTTMSGTSMASPHTAGAAALYLSRNTTATPDQVENAIRSYAVNPGTLSKDGRAIQLLQVGAF